ncbi:hypothetical protein D3C87_26560 [compost metagenome]
MNLKLILPLSLTVVFTVSVRAQAPIPELLYYRFNESGTIVPNYASNPPGGTDTAYVIGGLTQGPTGQCGNALIGNGQSSNSNYVNTGWQTNLTGTSWTMSFWTNNVPSTTTTYYILGDINAGQIRVFTGGVAGAGNWILRGAFTDVYANGGASTGPSMTTFVYDMPNNEIRSYVNGVLSSTVAQAMVAITGTGPFKVGGYATSNCLPSGSFMDEFRLYDRVLTQAEIQSLLIAGTTNSFSVTACGSYTVPSNDETYTTSGIYMDTIPNANGCDSIMTIDVTILPLSYDTISPVVCDQYTSPSGNYNWTSSGIYTDTLTNSVGCDSIVTINLTVNETSFDTIAESACNNYTAPDGSVYNLTGTYTATIMSMGGCDSTITIHLTVEQMDTTVSYSGGTLTANQTGVSYQWIDCGTMNPVTGATSQSFSPSSNGDYFVNLNGTICAISSDCYTVSDLGLGEFSQLNLILFPNPVSDQLNIENTSGEELILELYDSAGKLLQKIVTSEVANIIEMRNRAAGIYQLKARSKTAEKTFKIIHN